MSRLSKIVLVGAVTLALLYMALKDIAIGDIVSAFRGVSIPDIFLSLIFLILAYLTRAVRWRLLFPPNIQLPPFGKMFSVMMVGYLFNNLLPGRAGELVRAYLLGKKGDVSKLGTLSTILWERLCDATLLTVFLLIGMQAIHTDMQWFDRLLWGCLIFPLSIPILLLISMKQSLLLGVLKSWGKVLSGEMIESVVKRLEVMLQYLSPFLSIRVAAYQAIWVLIVWCLEAISYAFIMRSFGADFDLSTVLLFVAGVNFASLVPAVPGGLGAIEFVGSKALVACGVSPTFALSMVICQHAMQYILTLVTGSLAAVNLGFRFRDIDEDADFFKNKERLKDSISRVTENVSSARELLDRLGEEHSPVLSIVIPAYNEERRIGPTLVDCVRFLERGSFSYEIIVVDDGSLDRTAELVEELGVAQPTVRLLRMEKNSGKGAAVRSGMLEAKGSLLLFSDADGATPIAEVTRLITEMAHTNCDVIVASRALNSPETHVERKAHRFVVGRVFALLVNVFAVPKISDTQCGFKLFARDAGRKVFESQQMNGFAFDVEVLFLARKFGYEIGEVAVNWHDVDGSKVSVFRDSVKMFRDIARIRWIHRG